MPIKRSLEEELRELKKERADRERRGVLPREIERQHKFPVNEWPGDDDAHPDSGWVYAKEWTVDPIPPAGPVVTGHGGPRSGVPCQRCGKDTYIVDELQPGEILEFAEGNKTKKMVVKDPDGIAMLACSSDHWMQWRVSMLPTKSHLLWTP